MMHFITEHFKNIAKNATDQQKKCTKIWRFVLFGSVHFYRVLRIVLEKNGWEEGQEDDKRCHLIWTDLSVGPDKLMKLNKGQKINHFHGMLAICRKKSLFCSLSTMRKLFPADYMFFPQAFILPNQLSNLLNCFSRSKVKTFILKPDNGSQGRGVVLAQSVRDVRQAMDGFPGSNLVAQKYITKPMLINGFKFDLRIYVLILSCDPLRLYLYREGIARFCTERYQKPGPENLSKNCMHLTNYAVNKYNPNFCFNTNENETSKGHKWTLTSLFKTLSIQGFDTTILHQKICHIVVMTILAIVPLLQHNYKTYVGDDNGQSCFELLGMDVLIDHRCIPWLLEVNHSPSFSIDTPLDLKVKESLITDTLKLVQMDPQGISKLRQQDKKGAQMRLYGKSPPLPIAMDKPKHTSKLNQVVFHLNHDFEDHEAKNMGKYECIYPSHDKKKQDLYNKFLDGAQSIFSHSFDMKVKETIAKVQKEHNQEKKSKNEETTKVDKCKKAQRDARMAALAAIAISKNPSRNIMLLIGQKSLNQCKNISKDIVGSLPRLKKTQQFDQWLSTTHTKPTIINKKEQLELRASSPLESVLDCENRRDFVENVMVSQEKINQWQLKNPL
ncbi:uncharacterized protein [Physcomitrium patens]|nr:tubulin polyglutamylase TTLL6-like isoform X4 [Physcomitrium patens]|eukprot:XP_024377743.1 tubulin polyglutamylase TTLL6-like isoform X4 [Physcomitrella patens]